MPDDKTLSVTNPAEAKAAGVRVYGDPDAWVCVAKAWNEAEGWMKSTKVMEVRNQGCLVQTQTQQRNLNGSWSLSESMVFVPNATVACFLPKKDAPEKATTETKVAPEVKEMKKEKKDG